MAGYRDTSNYDPFAGTEYGRPLKPFNKWQWAGVGMGVAGALVMLGSLAVRLRGMAVDTADWLPMGTTLCAFGAVLINSRRATLTPEETAARRRRALVIIAVAAAVCVLAAAAVIIYFKGA